MATTKTVESIREYLNSLGQEAKPIVNKEAVKSLKAEIRGTSDPIEKLRLLSQLEDEEAGTLPDTSGLEAVFKNEAQKWAEGEGISVSAFQSLGVPDDVLKAAGFKVTAAAPKAAATSDRAKRLDPIADVLPVAQKLKTFTPGELAEAIDRSTATTKNYVDTLVEAGKIVKTDETRKPEGAKGRAAAVYKIA